MAPTPHRPKRCWRREAWDSALPTSSQSARLSPCPPSSPPSAHLTPVHPPHTCLPASVHVHPPHPSAHLARLPASVHVRPPHPSALLTPVRPPQPCLLSSPVCPSTHGPPSSPWSKCLTRLRRDQLFPGGSASGRHPPWSKDRGSGGQHSLGVGRARVAHGTPRPGLTRPPRQGADHA